MEAAVHTVLLALLVVVALTIAYVDSVLAAIMLSGIYSFLMASVFLMLDAADVALTEAAVGAGIVTVLGLVALSLTSERERPRKRRVLPALAVVTAAGAALIYATADMPTVGDPGAPVHNHVAPRYLAETPDAIGIPNVVTAVLADYRGFDTLGEVAVIFAAGVGVPPSPTRPERQMSESPILRVAAKILIPFIVLFGLYVQFHGDYGPGGGFQAGVIVSAGCILYGIVFGLGRLRAAIPVGLVQALAAVGLALYAGTGVVTMLLGGRYLDYARLAGDPAHGHHYGILIVELGVGITVTATMLAIYHAFAGRGETGDG